MSNKLVAVCYFYNYGIQILFDHSACTLHCTLPGCVSVLAVNDVSWPTSLLLADVAGCSIGQVIQYV